MNTMITYYQITILVLLIVGFIMSLTIRQYYKQYITAIRVVKAIDIERQNLQLKYEGKSTLMNFQKLMNDYDNRKQKGDA